MTSENDNALDAARKLLRLSRRIIGRKPAPWSSFTVPDPTAESGYREVVSSRAGR